MTVRDERAAEVLAWLERRGSARARTELLTRYGITAPKAYGVPMAQLKQKGRELGRDHDLAIALWATGWYEARLLTSFVDEPSRVTAAQMDRWARDFDNWGICDTVCFHLFDRTPHAWRKIEQWSTARPEFVKRAAFALLACVALHDKSAPDEPFLHSLALIERAAPDERHFVSKGISWAVRAIGRRNATLRAATIAAARGMADTDASSAQQIGRLALREFKVPPTSRGGTRTH